MKRIITLLVVLLQVVIVQGLKAQIDPHFSQYYAYPLWLNPALTGVINGQARVNTNYKNQWPALGNAYQTGAISVDGKLNDQVSLGVNVLDQRSGSAGFNYLAEYVSFAYGIVVSNDGNQKINFGIQAGAISRSFDPTKLQLGSQYNNETGFDPTALSGETFNRASSTMFDASAGVFYYNGNPLSKANVFGGFSVSHLNRAKDEFAVDGPDSRVPMRYTVQAGVKLKASDFFDITPHVIYIKQQDNEIRAFGVYSEIKVRDDQGLVLGGMYRLQDAAVANMGYHVNNYIFGFSYDFNTSPLRSATSGQGGFELSISYVFRKPVLEPEPVCPRL
jgi:type IX secretion system PorP/SprF family membrane protein